MGVKIFFLILVDKSHYLAAHYHKFNGLLLQFAEQHESPLITEIGLYGFHHLIVVVANRLELVIKIGEPDVEVRRCRVYFYYFNSPIQQHGFDEFGVMHRL